MKRVIVTGIGVVSPLGNTLSEAWNSAKAGMSGIGLISRFDASSIKWRVAGELRAFDPGKYLSPKEVLRLDPFVHYAVAAAAQASEDAGFVKEGKGGVLEHAGVIIGSSRGGISTLEKSIVKSRLSPPAGVVNESLSRSRVSAYLMPATTISMAASYVAQKIGLKGPCLGISNACASGTNAIGEAYRYIRHGDLKTMFCGGAEAP
ncbi:MAG: beta-ketoacyl synthase N-terminal-like domain-containing protein, partial [Nitrospirota bacterium]